MDDWIENKGIAPDIDFVDVKINQDDPAQPGIPHVKYWQRPQEWDWNAGWSDVKITHYRHSGY